MRIDENFDREFTCARCDVTRTYAACNCHRDDTWEEEWAVVWATGLLPAYWPVQVTPSQFVPPADRQYWEVCVDCLTESEAKSLAAYREADGVVLNVDVSEVQEDE